MTEEPQLTASPAAAGVCGEETVELQLSAEEQQLLQRAGAERLAAENPSYDNFILRRSRRIDRMGSVTFATLILAVTALTGWRALVSEPATPGVSAAPPVAATPPPAAPADEPAQAGVKVSNPFDRAEVFQFPAETTPTEAQNAVAELLLQRARDRDEQGLIQHRVNWRPPLHMASADPLNVFVTKLPRPAGGSDGTASLRAETASPE
jgi:hypothetical protein